MKTREMKTRMFIAMVTLAMLGTLSMEAAKNPILALPVLESNTAFDTTTLTVTIDEVKEKKGTIIFILWNQKEGFPSEMEKAYKRIKVTDYDKTATCVFEDVPYGNYALTAFQDKDDDGEMDRNFFKMPKEPAAMSNMTGMGIPSFKKSTIVLDAPETAITLTFVND